MIRQTQDGDIPMLIKILNRVYVQLPPEYRSLQNWEEYIQRNDSFVFEVKGNVVAHTALESFRVEDTLCGILARAFVDPKYQNRGIYQEMCKLRIKKAREKKYAYLDSHVVTYSEKTQGILIQKFGFTAIGLSPNSYPDLIGLGSKETMVHLRKALLLPDTKAQTPEGYVANWNQGGWVYTKTEDSFDSKKITLHKKAKNLIHTQ